MTWKSIKDDSFIITINFPVGKFGSKVSSEHQLVFLACYDYHLPACLWFSSKKPQQGWLSSVCRFTKHGRKTMAPNHCRLPANRRLPRALSRCRRAPSAIRRIRPCPKFPIWVKWLLRATMPRRRYHCHRQSKTHYTKWPNLGQLVQGSFSYS